MAARKVGDGGTATFCQQDVGHGLDKQALQRLGDRVDEADRDVDVGRQVAIDERGVEDAAHAEHRL